jgi:hypothetical protein
VNRGAHNPLLDHFVGAVEQYRGHFNCERLFGLQLMTGQDNDGPLLCDIPPQGPASLGLREIEGGTVGIEDVPSTLFNVGIYQ